MGTLYPAAPPVFGPREFLKVAACGLILVIIQGALTALVGFPGYGPEWVLVLALYVALRSELWVTALASLVLGFFRDALGGLWLGLWPFSLMMVTWLFHPFRSRLNFFNPLVLTPLVFMLCFGGYLFVMTPVMAILGWPGRRFNPLPAFLVSSLMTALTAPLIFSLLDWLTRRKDPQDG